MSFVAIDGYLLISMNRIHAVLRLVEATMHPADPSRRGTRPMAWNLLMS